MIVSYLSMPPLDWLLPRDIDWLIASGVPMAAILQPVPVRLAHGFKARDGRFEIDANGPVWFAFVQSDDVVFWRPGTVELATWDGRSFALGEAVIDNPATYSLGHSLTLFSNPLDWMRAGRDGCVVLDWSPRAFDRLRDCPRITVEEALESTLYHHLQPPRLPEIFVLCESKETSE